jgi:hypothetical protein
VIENNGSYVSACNMTRNDRFLLAALFAIPNLGCPIDDGGNDDGEGEASTSAEATGGTTMDPPMTTTETSTTTSGSTTDPGTSTEPSESGSDTDVPGSCVDATLWAGNPFFDGDFWGWDPAGQPLLGDPPLRSMQFATVGDRVAIGTQTAVWLADDAEAVRIAGDEDEPIVQYQPSGPCAGTRLIQVEGVAAMPNGNIVVADHVGNGLLEVSDPLGACMVTPIAGNAMPALWGDLDDVAFPGDVDGPGVDARFYGVDLPVADADGNVYVVDLYNAKFKVVANDAARTVSTLASFDPDIIPFAMTELDGTLYAVGSTGNEDVLMTVDAAAPGEPTILFQGRGLFAEFDESTQAVLAGIAHDGADLLVASAKGYLWRVSTTGEPLATIAGTGQIAEIPADLDVTAPIPLDQLPLRTYSLPRQILAARDGDFLFAGVNGGIGYHVWSINCR